MRSGTAGRLAITAALAALVGATAAPPVTLSDVQQKYSEGDYPGAIAGASRLLAVTGGAAASVDKAQVYAIKANAELHLKQFSPAGDAFSRAAKAATDPQVQATDVAMALLIKKSHNGAYAPKQAGSDGAKPSPVDVVSDADRKTALTALFEDEFAAATPKLTAAKAVKSAGSMSVLQSAIDSLLLLHQLEEAATGSDEKTRAEIDAVTKQAHEVLDTVIKAMADRVEQIKTASEVLSTTPGHRPGQKVGVTAQNNTELQTIITNAQGGKQAADKFDTSRTAAIATSASKTTAAAGAGTDTTATGAATSGADGGSSDLSDIITQADKVISDTQALMTEYKASTTAKNTSGYGGRSSGGSRRSTR